MKEFLWSVRIYYEDTDSGGVVYYANYLKYMERARTEWLRSLGFEQDQLINEQGVIFAVRSINVEYKKPARFNDLLQVSAELIERGGASLTFRQNVVNENKDNPEADQLLCSGQIRIACLDAEKMHPCPIPEQIVTEISRER
ncbi:MAG: tol-pal system-associated acyl-CoA thioesterase [Gammaproteobacteria bacterium]|nr:tol-pal system-associated acyl-CoA thioesterase [Gammaproteobacteria bacterium]